MNELELLQKIYLDDLESKVHYGGLQRSRVKHPQKWKNLVPLFENQASKLDIMLDNTRKVFVWSDLHFFHKNIISFSERPYSNVDEMNEHLVANFNNYVGPNDISIWVGDVGFGSDNAINKLLDQCNGYKILVVGNHDFNGKKFRHLNFDETHLLYQLDATPEVNLVFTHYPMHNISLPWFNVHGHLHAYPKPHTGNVLHYNVNCELHEYRPIELERIIKIAKMRLIAKVM